MKVEWQDSHYKHRFRGHELATIGQLVREFEESLQSSADMEFRIIEALVSLKIDDSSQIIEGAFTFPTGYERRFNPSPNQDNIFKILERAYYGKIWYISDAD